MTLSKARHTTICGGLEFRWGKKTYVMAVLNITPDSFSGDGLSSDTDAAIESALRMEEEGADIIDVGGESTRRYNDGRRATPVDEEEELRRVLPVIERLTARLTIPISVDTYKPGVAGRALQAGASMVNDVWGVNPDSEMIRVVAEGRVPVVLMHNKNDHHYQDLVPEVIESLRIAASVAVEMGVARENIIVDPGIGFGKVAEQSLELERRLGELRVLELPVLVGPSRKSHIGLALGGLSAEERVEGTAAAVAICIAGGADIVRVHDVKEMVRVARMSDAIVRGWRAEG